MASKIRNALKVGATLDVYKIEKILGQGGFGITYLAEDVNLEKKVAIKEYLPVGLAIREGGSAVQPESTEAEADFRWGLDQFLGEAKTLAKFQHPNIVQVLRFFEAHGTAYIVMNFVQGQSLHDRMQRRKKINEEELKKFLFPILDGLESVHEAGFLHRDIKPGNIFIADDGEPMLLDFGAARSALLDKSRGLTAIVTRGYAPIEQYSKRGHQGPWTDIYALAGVLYEIVTGNDPIEATDRVIEDPQLPAFEAGVGRLSDTLLMAIDHALAVHPEHRPRSVAAWRAELKGEAEIPALAGPPVSGAAASEVASDIPRQSGPPQSGPRQSGRLSDQLSESGAASKGNSKGKSKGATPTGPSRDPKKRPRGTEPEKPRRSGHTIVAGWKGAPVKALPAKAGLRGRRGRALAASIVLLVAAGLTVALWPEADEPAGPAALAVKPDFTAEERRFAEMTRRFGRERAELARRAAEKEKKQTQEKTKSEATVRLRGLIAGSQVAFVRSRGLGRHEARWTFHAGGVLSGSAFDSDGGRDDELNSTTDRGKWWVDGDALCVRWRRWDRRRTRCYAISQVRGRTYVAHGRGGLLSGPFTLEK
jgi:serine/threonine protein kinase